MREKGQRFTISGGVGGWTRVICPGCQSVQMIYAMDVARGMIETICHERLCRAVLTVVFNGSPATKHTNAVGSKHPDRVETWLCPFCLSPHQWPANLPAEEITCSCQRRIRVGR